MRIAVKPATLADIKVFYPDGLPLSGRCLSAWAGDELMGICGVLHGDMYQAFSNIKPELKDYPAGIIRTGRALQKLMARYPAPVYAVADEAELTAPKFLRHLGFEPAGIFDNKELYIWHQHS